MAQQSETPVSDNLLALGSLILRCNHVGVPWGLWFDPELRRADIRYELRIHEGPARGIYRGATATHAASKALAALDEHRIGWEKSS